MADLQNLEYRVIALETLVEELTAALPPETVVAIIQRAQPPLRRFPASSQGATEVLLDKIRRRQRA